MTIFPLLLLFFITVSSVFGDATIIKNGCLNLTEDCEITLQLIEGNRAEDCQVFSTSDRSCSFETPENLPEENFQNLTEKFDEGFNNVVTSANITGNNTLTISRNNSTVVKLIENNDGSVNVEFEGKSEISENNGVKNVETELAGNTLWNKPAHKNGKIKRNADVKNFKCRCTAKSPRSSRMKRFSPEEDMGVLPQQSSVSGKILGCDLGFKLIGYIDLSTVQNLTIFTFHAGSPRSCASICKFGSKRQLFCEAFVYLQGSSRKATDDCYLLSSAPEKSLETQNNNEIYSKC